MMKQEVDCNGDILSFLNTSNTQKVNSFLEAQEITMLVPFVKGSSMRARKDASDSSINAVHCEALRPPTPR